MIPTPSFRTSKFSLWWNSWLAPAAPFPNSWGRSQVCVQGCPVQTLLFSTPASIFLLRLEWPPRSTEQIPVTPGRRAGCQRFRSQLSLNTGRAGRALTAWTGPWITCLLSLPRWLNRKKYCGRGVTRMEFLFNTSESHQLRCTNWSTWLFWNSFLYSSHISALVIPFWSAPCCCSVR